ncbi:MAG: CCA tRNA nucleotidyltransferase [Acidobacteria bacterium]|nr:CCA tRNA nucleotidyltransferase [Acidobacteriota bacterium]
MNAQTDNSRQRQAESPRQLAASIALRLRDNGYQAYFVGGCVRDIMRSQAREDVREEFPIKDYDIATDALPEQVQRIFPHSLAIGAQFGVVMVIEGGQRIEVATFRNDGLYTDGRRPDSVRYSTEAREDVQRRDFTVNGLLMDPLTGEVLDYVEGQRDIQRRLIRAIGEPARRFREDRLRMLRAVRFACTLNFELDRETFEAIPPLAAQIASVSAERVRDELLRILTSGHPRRGFELLDSTGLLPHILPEIAAMKGVAQPPQFHPEGDVWTHTLLMLEMLPANCASTLALGVLLHDVGKPPTFRVAQDRIRFDQHVPVGTRMAEVICQRLRLANDEQAQISALVANHLRWMDVPQMRPSTLKRFFRLDRFEEHLELHRLDCLSSHRDLENYEWVRTHLAQMSAAEIRPERLLSGEDLVVLGHAPGPLFREILQAVEDAQLDGNLDSRNAALNFVREHYPT